MSRSEFYKRRLNEVRGLYSDARGKLLGVLNDEKLRMQNYQDKSMRYLQGVMTAVNMRYREMASDSKAELFVRQEEIRNKVLEIPFFRFKKMFLKRRTFLRAIY